jgi:hypothetical protein
MRVALRYALIAALTALSACTCGPKQCSATSPCPGGAACGADGTCASPTLVSVVVSDRLARGCEVLLTEQSGTAVLEGKFDQGVVGTSLREAPRVALTFVAPGDAAIPGGGVRLALSSGTAAGVTVTKASCVDVKGARLPNAIVSLR